MLNPLALAIYCWVYNPPLRGICFFSETLLDKTKSPLESDYQLETVQSTFETSSEGASAVGQPNFELIYLTIRLMKAATS